MHVHRPARWATLPSQQIRMVPQESGDAVYTEEKATTDGGLSDHVAASQQIVRDMDARLGLQ